MRKKNLFLLLFCNSVLYAQISVSGCVYDKGSSQALEGAVIRLLNASDSVFIDGKVVNGTGCFELENINAGNYIIEIRFFGFKTHYKNFSVKTENITLKPSYLQEDAKMLGELVVIGKAAQMIVKGDTIEFNANAFKLGENSMVEDLLRKLPGVEITADGKIMVNGQEVAKIRVDGKKFFENDAEMATKNIPAELIDRVQVIEEKSEMAKLTGFEDDNTERIINLTFKESKKRGIFGNVGGSAGVDLDKNFRYDGNGFLNFINNNMQTAITAGGNNVNNVRSSRGRGSASNNGINSTQNTGVTNSTYVNSKLTLGGDLMLNHTQNNLVSNSERENFFERDFNARKYLTDTRKITDNYSINSRFELKYQRDSFNTFLFQPNIDYIYKTSKNDEDFHVVINHDTASSGHTFNQNFSNNANAALVFTYNHKSSKKLGRIFTARLNGGLDFANSENTNISDRVGTNQENINQISFQNGKKYSSDIRLSYVEPLWNVRNLLEVVAGFRSNITNLEKNQYNFDGTEYSIFNRDYSNSIKNNFFSEIFEINYRLTKKKYNMTLGFHIEPSQTYNFVNYGNDSTRNFFNEVVNFAPTVRFQYTFVKKNFIRVNYRGRTAQPSVNQLQPVKDNSDLMNQTIGNPLLNPSFSHNFMVNYSRLNEKLFSSFNINFMASLIQNALVSNSLFDISGKQYIQFVNAKQFPYNFNLGIMYNIPILRRKLNINTTTRGTFAKRYGYTEKDLPVADIDIDNLPLGKLSKTENYSVQEMLSLSYSCDFIEVGAKGAFRYSNIWNNLTEETTQTIDWTATGNVVLRLPLDFSLLSDVNYSTRKGYADFDKSEVIWNASLEKAFLKKQLILSFSAYDILHRSQNIRQIVGDNYIQYTKSNILQTYFMIGLTWKISKFSGMTSDKVEQSGSQQRRGGRQRF